MGASSSFKTAVLTTLFQNANLSNIGDATGIRGSSVAGSLWIALNTGTRNDDSSANECNYTGYARRPITRDSAFAISGNNASNAALVTFGKKTGGSDQTATHFKVFTAPTGGDLLISGDLASPLLISDNVQPEFAIGELDVNFT